VVASPGKLRMLKHMSKYHTFEDYSIRWVLWISLHWAAGRSTQFASKRICFLLGRVWVLGWIILELVKFLLPSFPATQVYTAPGT
jgi:hypothetical protein